MCLSGEEGTGVSPGAYESPLSREHRGPRAVLNALERLASGYSSECDRARQALAIAQSQNRDYQARLGQPFRHDALLSELTALRDQLKVGLSAGSHQADNQTGPTVSDLAERIKALNAANAIEAAPQRQRQTHSRAEEPITARIRRRAGTSGSSGNSATPGDLASGPGESVPANGSPQRINAKSTPQTPSSEQNPKPQDSHAKHRGGFKDRIATVRRSDDPEPSVP